MTLKQLKSHEQALTNTRLQWREQLSFLMDTRVESKENEEHCRVIKIKLLVIIINKENSECSFLIKFLVCIYTQVLISISSQLEISVKGNCENIPFFLLLYSSLRAGSGVSCGTGCVCQLCRELWGSLQGDRCCSRLGCRPRGDPAAQRPVQVTQNLRVSSTCQDLCSGK